MAEIRVLSEDTIDKIAAGEVVERPMSVVKELVENAMDAGATAVTIEIKNGGIDFIRVMDNGKGMEAEDVRLAFARHATSKIRSVEDLSHLSSMGFRGEALSSIAAVAQVEVVTKTKNDLTGIRYAIEGAVEKEFTETAAPEGTTFFVKNLFFNTPVRRKFLKQPPTEAGYIAELLERLAMARPDISFKYIQNGQIKFHTPGNKDLKEVIYRIYGREIANHLMPIELNEEGIKITGFLGKPEINRSNRNFEHYFINSRYVKSKILAKAIEDGYKQYLMQHKFPFVVLHFVMSGENVDVNVHPTKMEVRFSDEQYVYQTIVRAIIGTFRSKELIVNASFGKDTKVGKEEKTISEAVKQTEVLKQEAMRQQLFRQEFPKKEVVKNENRGQSVSKDENLKQNDTKQSNIKQSVAKQLIINQSTEKLSHKEFQFPPVNPVKKIEPFVITFEENVVASVVKETPLTQNYVKQEKAEKKPVLEKKAEQKTEQLTLFEQPFLSEKAKETYEILGQVFGTYWIVAYSDRMYLIDQHAAHEKVKYERLTAAVLAKEVVSQSILPPVVIQMSAKEERVVLEHFESFLNLGFEIEEFGDHAFCLRAVPVDLFGCSYQELFREMVDELMEGPLTGAPEVVLNKLASMACKAAVKGNRKLSMMEAQKLIDELLTLENPYHCPHGRPTIIAMSKQEIEKKFKRIV